MDTTLDWMKALSALRTQGFDYREIAERIGASSRSVRRWDQHRVRVQAGEVPIPRRETAPIQSYATALVRLVREEATV